MDSSASNPIIMLLLGALVPLIIGTLYSIVNRYVRRRVTIKSPEAALLEALNIKIDQVIEHQKHECESMQKIDAIIGSLVPAIKITVKKVRCDLGKFDDGETFNGDLEEAWSEIKKAEELHRGMRKIEVD